MRCRRLRPPDTETTGRRVKARPQGTQTLPAAHARDSPAEREGGRTHTTQAPRPPTSTPAALLHTVLVHVQREEHVRAAQGVLAAAGPAGAARSQRRVQVEGRLLSRGRPQLALVLELPTDGQRGRRLSGSGPSRRPARPPSPRPCSPRGGLGVPAPRRRGPPAGAPPGTGHPAGCWRPPRPAGPAGSGPGRTPPRPRRGRRSGRPPSPCARQ